MNFYQVAAASIMGLVSVAAAHAEGLCSREETAVFNCELKASVSSLCQSIENGSLIYRNGVGEKINLQISDKKNNRNVFFLSNTLYSGGGEAHIRFSRMGYTYYLYDKVIKVDDGPETFAGIVVYKKNKKIHSLACNNNASIRASAYQSISREKYRSIDVQ
ncbi:hypothetical protein [Burkholderia metallica]|uniref:hypothetical protein n=1 Tax=Burkholderia metallica TaxID=488729 RepID=UPI001CF412F6|nr:hypothetical protein [Burkholderia metallica]MCA8016932.1 hypothetical protein [Burkholderia metallica]